MKEFMMEFMPYIRDIMMAESYDAKVNKNITVNKESDLNVGLPLSE